MIHAMPCGCEVDEKNLHIGGGLPVSYCPKHAAVDELIAALRALTEEGPLARVVTHGLAQSVGYDDPLLASARAALAAAGVKL